jgi:acyl dehydratase
MSSIQVGSNASIKKTISDEDIRMFASISGDSNPVHLDDDYAANTRFGRRIAHGMLVASTISAVLGEHLPGHGSIYLGQSIKFLKPVYIGDEITTRVEVIQLREDKPIATLRTTCTNQQDEVVIDGEAVVLLTA